MPSSKKYFIDHYGLRALYIDKDENVKVIVRELMDAKKQILTCDHVIHLFIQDLINDGKDLTRIQTEIKKVQFTGGFRLGKPLNEEEFTNAKTRFENLKNKSITLMEWAILESTVKNGCNSIISSRNQYKDFDKLPKDLLSPFETIDFYPKY